MNFDIRFKITLPAAKDVMVAQSSQRVAGYKLENIKLKYGKITNADLYTQSYRVIRLDDHFRIKTLSFTNHSAGKWKVLGKTYELISPENP